jgi:hypothetical protein
LNFDSEIIVVSGLPRSGTSLMLQMLECGGVEVVTDRLRAADTDNPRGYFEFEKVKKIRQDASWLPATRGKAFKMISQLLYDLPATERYRVIFMERDLDEMLLSQEKMLERLGRKGADRDKIRSSYSLHLERLSGWFVDQAHLSVLYVNYNELLEQPERQAERVSAFLDGQAQIQEMAKAVDPSLYRNRKAGS